MGDNIYGFNGAGSSNGGFSNEAMQSQFPHVGKAHIALQRAVYSFVQRRRNISERHGDDALDYRESTGVDVYGTSLADGALCLHAKQLSILHPITTAPMIFEVDAPF